MTRARVLLIIVLVFLAQLVDSVILARWTVPAPDMTLLVVAAMAVLRGSRVGFTVGLYAGLLADLFPPSAGLLGWTALAYAAAGALAGRWYRPLWSWVLSMIAAGVAAAVATALSAMLGVLSGAYSFQQLMSMIGMSTVISVLGAAMVIPGIVQLDRFAVGERPELSWQAALPRNSRSGWRRPRRRR